MLSGLTFVFYLLKTEGQVVAQIIIYAIFYVVIFRGVYTTLLILKEAFDKAKREN